MTISNDTPMAHIRQRRSFVDWGRFAKGNYACQFHSTHNAHFPLGPLQEEQVGVEEAGDSDFEMEVQGQ
jgi:hypothetical protein